MATKDSTRRTVLITGATGGIGAKIAVCFARNGWDIICHYYSSSKKASVLGRVLEKYDINCHFLKADFLSEKQVSVFI